MKYKLILLMLFLAPILPITGCISPPAKLYVAESSLHAGDIIMRTHPCMKQFHVQETWLPSGYCTVDCFAVIENRTEQEILIGKEEFSNGYYSIELLLRTGDGKIFNLEKADATWYRNLPEYLVIPPKGRLCWPVSLERSHWKGMPKLRPTIEDYLATPDVVVEEDGSFLLPPEVDDAMCQNVEIQIKVVFKDLLDSHGSKMCDKIESDWTKVLFGGTRDRVFIPQATGLIEVKPHP